MRDETPPWIDCPNPKCTGGYVTEIGRVVGVMGYEYEREVTCPNCNKETGDEGSQPLRHDPHESDEVRDRLRSDAGR